MWPRTMQRLKPFAKQMHVAHVCTCVQMDFPRDDVKAQCKQDNVQHKALDTSLTQAI